MTTMALRPAEDFEHMEEDLRVVNEDNRMTALYHAIMQLRLAPGLHQMRHPIPECENDFEVHFTAKLGHYLGLAAATDAGSDE